jgi:hypothetical protein
VEDSLLIMVGLSMDLYVLLMGDLWELIVDAFATGFGWIWYVNLSLSFIFTARDFTHDCLRGGMLMTIVGKTNPFGRSFPHGFYKTPY